MSHLPLNGIVVLELSQYLSGPSAGLRLADLGARVIKVERPGAGDPCRKLALKNLWAGDNSVLFHTINRNKESFTADLKNPEDIALIKQLIPKVDVITNNFRPGVMEKLGLGYEALCAINPRLIYAEISGYGKTSVWKDKPGQDLLLQSLSGLAYTTGNEADAPIPFGLSIADSICGIHMAQAILAALIKRQKTNKGTYIELSLLESILNFQFELLTTHNHKKDGIKRSKVHNGNPLLGAPYGVYKTRDGFIALAMMGLPELAAVLDLEVLRDFGKDCVFQKRDEIKTLIAKRLREENTLFWTEKLQQAGLWATKVLTWQELTKEEGYKALKMELSLQVQGKNYITTRCPIVINGEKLYSAKPGPELGADTEKIKKEFLHAAN